MSPFQHHSEDFYRRNVRSHAHRPARVTPMDVVDALSFVCVIFGLIVLVAIVGPR